MAEGGGGGWEYVKTLAGVQKSVTGNVNVHSQLVVDPPDQRSPSQSAKSAVELLLLW